MLTRAVQTFINVLLAQSAPVARLAPALEPVDLVHALALVQARVAGTLVHIDLTVVSVCSGQTVTLKKHLNHNKKGLVINKFLTL